MPRHVSFSVLLRFVVRYMCMLISSDQRYEPSVAERVSRPSYLVIQYILSKFAQIERHAEFRKANLPITITLRLIFDICCIMRFFSSLVSHRRAHDRLIVGTFSD